MNDQSNPPQPDEAALVKLYIDLTGATEAEARAVVTHTCYRVEEKQKPTGLAGLFQDSTPPPAPEG